MNILGDLLAMANGLFFAASSIFNRLGLDEMDKEAGMLVTLIVNNIINAGALLVLYLTGNWVKFTSWQSILWFFIAGAFTSFLGRYLLLESVRLNGPSRSGAFKVASPVFTIFIGIGIIGEKVSPGSLLGAVLILFGLLNVSARKELKTKDKQKDTDEKIEKGDVLKPFNKKGIIIGLASGFAFAIGQIARKVGLSFWPSSLAGAMVGSSVALTLTLISLYSSGKKPIWKELFSKKAINYVWSGICTSLAIISFFFSLMLIPISIANVIGGLEPIFTIILAFLILGKREKITLQLILGALFVTVGVSFIFYF